MQKCIMKFEWDDMRFLLAVLRAGTLMAAGDALGVNYTTVSRRIKKLEQDLGHVLLEHSPEGYRPTQAALAILPRIEAAESHFHSIAQALSGGEAEVKGDLRVTFPSSIGRILVLPYLKEFQDKYPDIHITVLASSELSDLGSSGQADIAVRLSRNPPDYLLGKRVAHLAYALYAAPQYLKACPTPATSGAQLAALSGDRMREQIMAVQAAYPSVRMGSVFSGWSAIESLVENEGGFGILPCFMGDRNSRLQRVAFTLPETGLHMWILSHPDYRQSARIQAFKNFLAEKFQQNKALIEGCA